VDGMIFVIVIVAIVCGSLTSKRVLQHRLRSNELKMKLEAEYSGELVKEVESLKHRVASLEKIVTQKGYQLHDEIDNL